MDYSRVHRRGFWSMVWNVGWGREFVKQIIYGKELIIVGEFGKRHNWLRYLRSENGRWRRGKDEKDAKHEGADPG